MNYLLYGIYFLASIGQLQRLTFFDASVNIYLHEIFMVVFILSNLRVTLSEIGAVLKVDEKLCSVVLTGLFFLIVLGLSLTGLFWTYSASDNIVGFLYWARLSGYFGFGLTLLVLTYGNRRWNDILNNGLFLFTIATVTLAILQYRLYPNLRNLYYLGWDPHQFRVFGTFLDTTITGVILSILFIWLLEKRKILLSIVLAFLILFTYSRAAYVSLLAGLGFYFRSRLNVIKLTTAVLFCLFFLTLLPRPFGEGVKLERTFSVFSRLTDQRQGLQLWARHPLWGVGYNRIPVYKPSDESGFPNHARAAYSSSLVTLLASSGLIGLLGWVGFLWRLYVWTGRTGRAVIALVFVASLMDNIFLTNFVLLTSLSVIAATRLPFGSER